LEYIPCGSLDAHQDITYNETLAILEQCLSALDYLHKGKKPIAHRDIKPANILVEYRFDGEMYVKLGDFGLSREGPDWATICGTGTYLAPEIRSGLQPSVGSGRSPVYTTAVDIWSLGVVACELLCGLPQSEEPCREIGHGIGWCKEVVKWLEKNEQQAPTALGQFLLSSMLVVSQESRLSASECYHETVGLPSAEDSSFVVWTSQATRDATEEDTAEDKAATLLWPPRSWTVDDTNRLRRSAAPTPETTSLPINMTLSSDEASGSSERPSSTTIRRQEGSEHRRFAQHYSLNAGLPPVSELGGEEPDEHKERELTALLLQSIVSDGDGLSTASPVGAGLEPARLPAGNEGPPTRSFTKAINTSST